MTRPLTTCSHLRAMVKINIRHMRWSNAAVYRDAIRLRHVTYILLQRDGNIVLIAIVCALCFKGIIEQGRSIQCIVW